MGTGQGAVMRGAWKVLWGAWGVMLKQGEKCGAQGISFGAGAWSWAGSGKPEMVLKGRGVGSWPRGGLTVLPTSRGGSG